MMLSLQGCVIGRNVAEPRRSKRKAAPRNLTTIEDGIHRESVCDVVERYHNCVPPRMEIDRVPPRLSQAS